jgi:hypothetical protein
MNKRFQLWLLLVLLLSLEKATAQNVSPSPPKQSHYHLPGGPDPSNAQEMMAQRLQELHFLQGQVQELFQKSEVRDRFQHLLEQLRKQKGETQGQDRNWAQLLSQMNQSLPLPINQRYIDTLLRHWAEHTEHKQMPSGNFPMFNSSRPIVLPPIRPVPGSSVPSPFLPGPAGPGSSPLDRFQQEMTKWLMERFEDLSGDTLQTLTEVEAHSRAEGGNEGIVSLVEMLRSALQPDLTGRDLREPMMDLARHLSNVGEWVHYSGGVWNEMRSFLRQTSLPSLSRSGGPSVSMPSSVRAEGAGWAPALLSLLVLAGIILLLCKSGPSSQAAVKRQETEWHLGPWPVSPDAVSTRQDVVRAFEYLALLRLGPAAVACHHRQLAERLAEQDNDNPRRRQAAEMLAWWYEQARYAPDGERLFSPEQLSDIRHALCLLARAPVA